jgi:hypothetical protein
MLGPWFWKEKTRAKEDAEKFGGITKIDLSG